LNRVPGLPSTDVEVRALQRRSVRILVASQILGGVGVGAGIAVISLLAYELSGTASLSGVSPTASTLGAALAALVIARLTVRSGRRLGLVVGYLVGAAGAALAVVAAVWGSFPLHVIASLGFGWASASNLQARYAATDLATDDRRASALSTVVWATTIGAVLGPNLTGPGSAVAASLGLPDLAGPYVFSFVAFVAAAGVQLAGLRPDPLVVAQGLARSPVTEIPDAAAPPSVVGSAPVPSSTRRPLADPATDADVGPEARPGVGPAPAPDGSLRAAIRTIRAVPAAEAAFVAIAAAHATMVGVMVMTPVHMETHGAALRLVGLTISLHIAGMYALSPVVGRLADRFGRRTVLLAGLSQLGVASVLAATSEPMGSVWFQIALVLLGSGWSTCLVAGSTLLTEVLTPQERPAAQGASDLVMNLSGGVGGTLAGIVLAFASYEALAFGALGLLLMPAWLLVRLRPTVSAGISMFPGLTTRVPPTTSSVPAERRGTGRTDEVDTLG
jgi:MFS family permease